MSSALRPVAFLSLAGLIASLANADTFGSLLPFEIEFVTIGNPGNPDDTTGDPNPAGKVDYTYRISKYEISEAMIDAANAEGSLGLTKEVTLGPNKPATGISWLEAATFANWLNTSQGHQAAYNIDGNGNFGLWSSGEAWQRGGENLFRHKHTVYFLPSVDEWYKAAYYDPDLNGGAGGYWNFPTVNTFPIPVPSGTGAGTAVYSLSPSSFLGPADINQAGGLSPYGTMGQGGNVEEWEETEFDLVNDSSSSARGIRGGHFYNGSNSLSSSYRRSRSPTNGNFVGFRVASIAVIPEPSSSLLGAFAAVGLLLRRSRRI